MLKRTYPILIAIIIVIIVSIVNVICIIVVATTATSLLTLCVFVFCLCLIEAFKDIVFIIIIGSSANSVDSGVGLCVNIAMADYRLHTHTHNLYYIYARKTLYQNILRQNHHPKKI